METVNNHLYRWFGMDFRTAVQVAIIGALCVLFAIGFITAIILLISDPSQASSVSWGFAD